MTQPDSLFDQTHRSERDRTQRRRAKRLRQRRVYLFAGLMILALLVLAGPSLLSHSPAGRSLVASQLAKYGLQGQVAQVRIGWVTPLRIDELTVRGASGATELVVDRIDVDVTVADLIRRRSTTQQITLRGVTMACQVASGISSLEEDLQPLLNQPATGTPFSGHIDLMDVTATIQDAVTGETWQLAQASANVEMAGPTTHAKFSGVLTEPRGAGGTLQGELNFGNAGAGEAASQQWFVNLNGDSVPLSVVSILRRRFPETADAIPSQVQGDATGEITVASATDGSIEASIDGLSVRNLSAIDDPAEGDEGSGPTKTKDHRQPKLLWQNSLATLGGELTLTPGRLIGRRLRATSDFGEATIDGAFSREFSWVGTADNPLRWLEGIDGIATLEVDLPKLQSALPGIMPIRSDAKLMSGRASARVESLPPKNRGEIRRSELSIHSDAIRARSHGQAVTIDPLDLHAIVVSDRDRVRADRFEWTSSFGKAVGQGDLRSGEVDVEVDFGRLTTMLRPIVDLADTTWAGTASGEIRWDASPENVWRLSGQGAANDLLVTLGGGETFQRNSVRGEIEAVGRWGNGSLQSLSEALVTIDTDSLKVKAELVDPVTSPSPQTRMPVRLVSSGRLETLHEILAAWLPAAWHHSEGDFQLTALSDVSTASMNLHRADLKLHNPQLSYADRVFQQQDVRLKFSGDFEVPDFEQPAIEMRAKECKIDGNGFAADLTGTAQWSAAGKDAIDLTVQWNADLMSLQGRTASRVAYESSSVRPVGFRSDASTADGSGEDWEIAGDCQGDFRVIRNGDWIEFTHDTSGENVSLLQSPAAESQAESGRPTTGSASRPLWTEPNVKLGGVLRVQPEKGLYEAVGFGVSCQWFAITMDGRLVWNDHDFEMHLKGPARLKMDEVGRLLTPMTGTEIELAGIHETEVSIDLGRTPREKTQGLNMKVQADLGWESGKIAGVHFGEARVPITMTDTTVVVSPSEIPVGRGLVRASGEIHYQPGPVWVQLDPGVVAESVELTTEMTDRWMKYLAPLAANTAHIQGTVSADVKEAMLVFDDPTRTRVSGQLKLSGIEMTSGPMADQLIGGVRELVSLAGGGDKSPSSETKQSLITMPPQQVDFSLDRGVVSHDRLYFEVDRAQVITSGSVGLDGRP